MRAERSLCKCKTPNADLIASSDMVKVVIELTADEYRAIAGLLERDYPYETTVAQYFQSCAQDIARDPVERSE